MTASKVLYSSDADFAVILCRNYNKCVENLKFTNAYGRNFSNIDVCQADAIHRAMNHRPWQSEY